MQNLVCIFHGIGEAPPHVPPAERPYWMPRQAFETFIRAAGDAASEQGVELLASFDDGNRSDIEIAAPLLLDRGIRGAFFPCAGRIGQRHYLAGADLRELRGMGFEIGSHGMDHVAWTALDAAGLTRELHAARTMLEQTIGQPLHSAAIPFGAYDRRVLKAMRAANYSTVHSSDPGLNQPGAWMPRRWGYRQDQPFDFGALVARSRQPLFRLMTALKRHAKSLR